MSAPVLVQEQKETAKELSKRFGFGYQYCLSFVKKGLKRGLAVKAVSPNLSMQDCLMIGAISFKKWEDRVKKGRR